MSYYEVLFDSIAHWLGGIKTCYPHFSFIISKPVRDSPNRNFFNKSRAHNVHYQFYISILLIFLLSMLLFFYLFIYFYFKFSTSLFIIGNEQKMSNNWSKINIPLAGAVICSIIFGWGLWSIIYLIDSKMMSNLNILRSTILINLVFSSTSSWDKTLHEFIVKLGWIWDER